MSDDGAPTEPPKAGKDFIREIIEADRAAGKHGGRVQTRFPPEPNGYLHIGHAKAICLNFDLAEEYGGLCNLRFDDTNPETEDPRFVDAIQEDVRWLGFDWGDRLFFASDYFDRFYELAQQLIRQGDAYVDSQTSDQIKETRGRGETAGVESPFRNRSIDENLDLFARMKQGEFADGAHVLRAKIDMAHPNHLMRDPTLYRIRNKHHYRTGDAWSIYPMYDFAHGYEDSFEGVTHSLCTLEFEMHRPLYDWLIEKVGIHHPQQIEFSRLSLTRTVMSKRKLLQLVNGNHVNGWDDPRLPTLAGMRRRGYPAAALRALCRHVGVTKFNSTHELALLEKFVRDELNESAPRRMAVLDPLEVVITNWPDDADRRVDWVDAVNNPQDPDSGTRPVPFSGRLYIEREDFMEDAPKKFFRLAPGREVRFKYGYYVTCDEVVKDDQGVITQLRCTYDPASRGGNTEDGRKIKGTIHWVSAEHAVRAEVRLYDYLLKAEEECAEDADLLDQINPDNLQTTSALVEPGLADCAVGETVQFERLGYFCADPDSAAGQPVFNRTVSLKSSFKL